MAETCSQCGKRLEGQEEREAKYRQGLWYCNEVCYSEWIKPRMKRESKINFGPDYQPAPSTAAIDLTFVAEEIRKSFSLGFNKAMEFYQTMTQPQAAALNRPVVSEFLGQEEEDDLAGGVLDMNSLSRLSPEGREAVLRNFGLQFAAPAAAEADPTHSVMAQTIKEGGHEPPESEDL